MALAAMLVHSYSVVLGHWVGISASRNFNQGLTTAVLQIATLSPATKIGIAIELLKIETQGAGEDEAEEIEDDSDCSSDECDTSLTTPMISRENHSISQTQPQA